MLVHCIRCDGCQESHTTLTGEEAKAWQEAAVLGWNLAKGRKHILYEQGDFCPKCAMNRGLAKPPAQTKEPDRVRWTGD